MFNGRGRPVALAAVLFAAGILAACGNSGTSGRGEGLASYSSVNTTVGFGGSGADLWATTSNGNLYLTTNGGSSWTQSTPPVSLLGLTSPTFNISQYGASDVWVVAPDNGTESLSESTNDGQTWSKPDPVSSIPIPSTARGAVGEQQVYVQILNPTVGYVVLDQYLTATGGFWTLDTSSNAGDSFTPTELPASGPVEFDSTDQGFLVGGPGDQSVFQSSDGGSTWTQLDVEPPVAANFTVGFPLTGTSASVVVPVTVSPSDGTTEVYFMTATAASSAAAAQTPAQPASGPWTVSGTSESVAMDNSPNGAWFGVAPDGSHVYSSNASGTSWTATASQGLPAGVTTVVSTGTNNAVAEVNDSTCTNKASCVSKASLYSTSDTGASWDSVSF